MPGFSSLANLKTALTASDARQYALYHKVSTAGTLVGVPYCFSMLGGLPSAISSPTAGLAGAVAVDKTTVGATIFNDAKSGTNNYLFRVNLSRNTTIAAGGLIFVADRLAHANVAINQGTGSFSPVIDGTARLAAGEGAMIIASVSSALSAASNTFTLTYTNQAGTAGRVTDQVVTVASRAVNNAPYSNNIFIPLQAGDSGARTITDWTLVSGTATGNIDIVLVKPLAFFSAATFPDSVEKEMIVQYFKVAKVHDSACLTVYYVPASTSSVPTQVDFEILNG